MLREKLKPMVGNIKAVAGSGRTGADEDAVFFFTAVNTAITRPPVRNKRPLAHMALRNAFPTINTETL